MGLLKLGAHLMKNSAIVDNVNSATQFFLTFDKNGDKELDPDEISAALETLKGVNTPEALNLRALCLFLTIALKKWQEDPAGTDERMSKSKPFGSSWDRDPKVAKVEKIVCTYYTTGIGEKVRTLMHLMERNPADYKIKEGTISGVGPYGGSGPQTYVETSRIGGGFFKHRDRISTNGELTEFGKMYYKVEELRKQNGGSIWESGRDAFSHVAHEAEAANFKSLEEMAKEKALDKLQDKIKDEVLEATIGPMLEELFQEVFGELLGEAILSMLL